MNRKTPPYFKRSFSRVYALGNFSDFERLRYKCMNGVLLVLFQTSYDSRKNVDLINKLAQQQTFKRVRFALVETDLNPEIGTALELKGAGPEFRIYRGETTIIRHEGDESGIVEDLTGLLRNCLGRSRNRKQSAVVLAISKTLAILCAGIISAVTISSVVTEDISFFLTRQISHNALHQLLFLKNQMSNIMLYLSILAQYLR